MKIKKKILLSLGIIFLYSGCSTKLPVGITKIEKNKHNSLKKNIHISGAAHKGFQAYINDEDQIKYLCSAKSSNACGYSRDFSKGDVFWINTQGYYPSISPQTKGVQCGKGSLYGYFAILMMPPVGIADYTHKNSTICNNRFTQLDSSQVAVRIIFGLFMFGTPLITGGTMHTMKFDAEKFKDAIFVTNIESFKKQLFEISSQYDVAEGFDIVYLEQDNIHENLQNKYEFLLKDHSKKSGVIFLEKDTNKLLGINVFKKYENENLIQSISLQIEDLLQNIANENKYTLRYDEVMKYIPVDIPLPPIPKVPQLIKDEFEKKSNFLKRVQIAVEQREFLIRNLQRKYSLDVFERNNYIQMLQDSYKFYLEQKTENKNKFLVSLKADIPWLLKVLFLENTSGYQAKDFKYNAETEKLYFQIYSQKQNFNQEVVAEIPSAIAKQIKIDNTFKVIPEIQATENKIQLLGFHILETQSDKSFDTKYTNIDFKPEEVSVRVTGMKESLQEEISDHFKQYIQKELPIVDTSKKEIWYIDIAKNINAKIPPWFSTPQNNHKVIGYGEGKNLTEAKSNARNDLAYMVKVKINTSYSNTQSVNNFASFSETKEKTLQSSDVQLSSNDYKIFKQDSVEGRWYVGLEYLK